MFPGEGDPCERHPAHPKRIGWGILECRECERERIESCVCKGSGMCVGCEECERGNLPRGHLCHACNPDD